MNSVLVLNASYEPLHIVSVHRALVLLLKDKAEVLEATEERIRSANLTMPNPLGDSPGILRARAAAHRDAADTAARCSCVTTIPASIAAPTAPTPT